MRFANNSYALFLRDSVARDIERLQKIRDNLLVDPCLGLLPALLYRNHKHSNPLNLKAMKK